MGRERINQAVDRLKVAGQGLKEHAKNVGPTLRDKLRDVRNKGPTEEDTPAMGSLEGALGGWRLALGDIVSVLIDLGVVVGPIVGYLSQYRTMLKRRSADGFAQQVAYILIVSNSLRLLYFFLLPPDLRFAESLVWQAVVMITMQIVLLELCTRINISAPGAPLSFFSITGSSPTDSSVARAEKPESPGGRPYRHAFLPWHRMWDGSLPNPCPRLYAPISLRISAFLSGLAQFLTVQSIVWRFFFRRTFPNRPSPSHQQLHLQGERGGGWMYSWFLVVVCLIVLCALVIDPLQRATLIGYISLLLESTLAIPQLVTNHRQRSTEGLDLLLVLTWFSGDLLKLIYFVYHSQPLPFLLCASIQITVDTLICSQILLYGERGRGRGQQGGPRARAGESTRAGLNRPQQVANGAPGADPIEKPAPTEPRPPRASNLSFSGPEPQRAASAPTLGASRPQGWQPQHDQPAAAAAFVEISLKDDVP